MCELGTLAHADGSASLQMGNTKVHMWIGKFSVVLLYGNPRVEPPNEHVVTRRYLRQCSDPTSRQAEVRLVMTDARSTATMRWQPLAPASADDAASQIGGPQRRSHSYELQLNRQSSWS